MKFYNFESLKGVTGIVRQLNCERSVVDNFFRIHLRLIKLSLNLLLDFFKFFKCRFFNNNSRKSAKIFVNNEKIETNN